MNGRYSIRREPEAMAVPFGSGGVAALAATLAGLIGLALPTSVLETLSFHLYLDTITDLAKPPLGTTAKLIGALVLALAAGGAAFVAARWLGIVSAPDGFGGLLDRLRGVDRDDEDDAPVLRSADRHPDAPARRPFSAMRDIPDRSWDEGDDLDLRQDDRVTSTVDEDEELLLDMTVAAHDDLNVEPELTELPRGDAPVESEPPFAADLHHDDDIANFDLAPPTLDDWEGSAASEAVESESEPLVLATQPEAAAVDIADERMVALPTMPTRPVARRDTAPLDLSAGRLDELIARLEAGLSRKAAAPPAAVPAMDDILMDEPEADHAGLAETTPMVDDDPAFPHDPALAAALATLRKMNLRTA